ncbi:SAVED domain-containing protein [Thiohalospira sp.]|uniref:SAVED domain-containing protein n=1 Tax=Thiohalospira sp. TaxID=3080549 RepID=UPI00397FAD97
MFESLYEFLDWTSIIIGILTFIPVVLTYLEVTVGRRRRHQRWFREACRESGNRAAILHVDLLPERDTDVTVWRFTSQRDDLGSIPSERYFHLHRKERLGPEDMPEFVRELREQIGEIGHAGVDTVHLFYAGPAVAAATVGAELANQFRVLVYHHQHSDYINFGPLRHI